MIIRNNRKDDHINNKKQLQKVTDNVNLKDLANQQYRQLTFENLGGQFKYYDFKEKEHKIDVEVKGKPMNYFLQEK